MMSITLEGIWMFSDRIVNFQFLIKFHRSGPAIIFSFWTFTEHVSCASKKLLIKPRFIRTLSRWWVLLWKDYGCFLIELTIFNFLSNFHRSGPAIILSFWTITEHVSYGTKKLLIKPRSIRASSRWWVLLYKDYGCFLIELLIFDFLIKFHRSGPAIIFSFWTITEHVSSASKKLLIKPRSIRASSRWWVLLRKDYGCFLIELSIFNFWSNFTGPGLQ